MALFGILKKSFFGGTEDGAQLHLAGEMPVAGYVAAVGMLKSAHGDELTVV